MDKIITVFTPVYNRKKLLLRLYESLTSQRNKAFEWIICDDCSSDGSYEQAKELEEKEDGFRIRVVRMERNGGKHRAINYGISFAEGFLFFIVDSDDMLPSDAIEKIFAWEKTIQGKKSIAGMGFLRADLSWKSLGTTFQEKFLDCTSLERKENHIFGDKAEVIYTDLFRKYPFPEFEDEKFLTEDIVWDRIAHDGYKIRWINEIAYLCDYQTDGLTANWDINLANNPEGYALWQKQKIHFMQCTGYERFCVVYGYYYTINLAKRYSMKYACEKMEYPLMKAYIYIPIRKVKRIVRRFQGLLRKNKR